MWTVHITALIIHLSLTITPDTHTVVLVSELDPLFKGGDAGTSFPTFYNTLLQIHLVSTGYHWIPWKIKSASCLNHLI